MRRKGGGTTGVAQGTVCNGQYTGTAVMASGDGSGWGSSSGCENQGSCARQGATMDTGDSSSGKERTAGAMAAVTEGSVVVRALLVRIGSCRRWCGSVRQGTVEAQGSATVGSGSGWCRRLLWLRLRQRLGRGGDGVTK